MKTLDLNGNIDDANKGAEEILSYLKKLKDVFAKGFAFILLSQESIILHELNRIFNILLANNFQIVCFDYFFKLNESKIESLYRFHLPDNIYSHQDYSINKQYPEIIKLVPSRNWRLLREKYTIGHSLAILLYNNRSDNASKELVRLKGSTDALLNSEKNIRYMIDNPILSGVHCSDCLIDSLRECLIFIDAEKVINSVCDFIQKPIKTSTLIKYCDVMRPYSCNYRFGANFVKLKMRILIKSYEKNILNSDLFMFYDKWSNIFLNLESGKEQILRLTEFLNEERALIENNNMYKNLYSLLYKFTQTNKFMLGYFESLIPEIEQLGIYLNKTEKVILDSGITYYRALN